MTIQATLNRSQVKWDTYMFLGDQYLSYSLTDNVVRVGPRAIGVGWPGLDDTQFAGSIDASVPFSYPPDPTALVPPPTSDYIYIFKADQYLRYDFANEKIIYGPLDIGQWWPGMKDAGFDKDLDAAFLDHRDAGLSLFEDTYFFFKGGKFVTYDPRADRVSGGPYSIADKWPGLRDLGFGKDLDAVVYNIIPPQVLAGPNARECYFVKADKVVQFDMEEWKPVTDARPIADFWYGLKGTDFASATPAPASAAVSGHAEFRFAFDNPGENNPNPYGSIQLDLKDGTHFRIWTQQNQGNSTPARSTAAASMNLPFTAADISGISFSVDEYDWASGDDYLAHGSQAFTGNGSYTVSADDGSVTVDVTIT